MERSAFTVPPHTRASRRVRVAVHPSIVHTEWQAVLVTMLQSLSSCFHSQAAPGTRLAVVHKSLPALTLASLGGACEAFAGSAGPWGSVACGLGLSGAHAWQCPSP